MPLDRSAARLKKRLEKKLHDWKQFVLHLYKLETCTYISLTAMYGLTAIDKILVAGWKHASFLCYSMGERWFLRILGPKLELPRSSAYSPYLKCLWFKQTTDHNESRAALFITDSNNHQLMSLIIVQIHHVVTLCLVKSCSLSAHYTVAYCRTVYVKYEWASAN